MSPCPQKRISSRLVSLLGSAPFKKPGPSADFEKVKGGRYLKEILILNSFSFEHKDPRFTRLKSVLALRLLRQLSKGLCYIRAMAQNPSVYYFVPIPSA